MPSEAASAVVKMAMYSPFPLAFSYEGGGLAPPCAVVTAWAFYAVVVGALLAARAAT